MKISQAEREISRRYQAAEPRPLGNLHERMKSVVNAAVEEDLAESHPDLWHAIHDLQTEVKYYEPANPPYGSRDV